MLKPSLAVIAWTLASVAFAQPSNRWDQPGLHEPRAPGPARYELDNRAEQARRMEQLRGQQRDERTELERQRLNETIRDEQLRVRAGRSLSEQAAQASPSPQRGSPRASQRSALRKQPVHPPR